MTPPDTITDNLTSAAALAAVASPLWLHQVSDLAQLVLPIAGLLWLAVQIASKLYISVTFRKK